MEKVHEILVYLYSRYPKSNELSYSRVMKLLYLIEWRFAITNFEQLTNINWVFTKFGPYYGNLIKDLEDSEDFEVYTKLDNHNSNQIIIRFIPSSKNDSNLKVSTKGIIDFVIHQCKELTWSDLNNIVNSTYGVIYTELNSEIKIVQLAKEYKNVQ